MQRPPTFRCPECDERLVGGQLAAHLAAHPPEREALFARFVSDHSDMVLDEAACSGSIEILPLMEDTEKGRFGVQDAGCGDRVMACACGGSFCVGHSFACDTCGRFACLRHRWSGTCPECTRASGAKPVKVEKYDPFSKQRSTFIRTYRRSTGRDVWDAVQPASGD